MHYVRENLPLRKHIAIHRSRAETCKLDWAIEQQSNKEWPIRKCQRISRLGKKCQVHRKYHSHRINRGRDLSEPTENIAKVQRRAISGSGASQENEKLGNDQIIFSTQDNMWTCILCKKTYEAQELQNATQHASGHNRTKNEKRPKWEMHNKQEIKLYLIREQALMNRKMLTKNRTPRKNDSKNGKRTERDRDFY